MLSDGVFQNHSRLRTPPLPLSHSHSPNHQHHAASVNSLNRSNYTPRSNQSPAPTDSSAPPEGSAQDSGSAQDNWLLNSNIPLETRYCRTRLQNIAQRRHVGIFENDWKLLPLSSAFHVVCSILFHHSATEEQIKENGQISRSHQRPNFVMNTSSVANKRKELILAVRLIVAVSQRTLLSLNCRVIIITLEKAKLHPGSHVQAS